MPKTQSPKCAQTRIDLPANLHLSDSEVATTINLVRVLRHQKYWLKHFIELLLEMHANSCSEELVSVKEARSLFLQVEILENCGQILDRVKSEAPDLFNRAVLVPPKPEVYDATIPADADEQFKELVRMWRTEHPKPQQPRTHPAGHLGRTDYYYED